MIVALDKDFNRIHIENAVAKQECYCPSCGARLFQRKGQLRRHHFAHMPGHVCTDTWASQYDMSDWHYEWQNSFPKQNQEVLLQLGETKHRADVLIGRAVTEFQHANMSAKTFSDRNTFYFNLGYKVIWVFDLLEQYASGQLSCDKDKKTFHWVKPRNTFNLFDILTGRVELFFHIESGDQERLVKVGRVSDSGFEKFTVSRWFDKEEFMNYLNVNDGACPPPDREDLSENPEYLSFCDKYHITLNKQQERAVQAIDGANLLLAVPGSGKTTVLVARLGYMILCKGIAPENILAMTFSKQAAKDMHSRFCSVFGAQLGQRVEFRTIHSVALQILKHYSRMCNRPVPHLLSDNTKTVATILKAYQDEYPSESETAETIAAITYIKNMSIPEVDIAELDLAVPQMNEVYKQYQQTLTENRLMDYDDQVAFAVQILKAKPEMLEWYQRQYRYICVDEAQDTSKIQHELLQLLVGSTGNIFMVGDEDQSIYRFRGAFPQALMDFKDTYPNPYILWMETNYRSTPEIVKVASEFISRNQNRYPKEMVAHRESGSQIQRIHVASRPKQYSILLEQAQGIPKDTAIIYRDNDSAIPLIDLFDRKCIPYRCPKREFRFFTHKTVMDVVSFMKLQQNPKDVDAFQRIYYKAGFYLDKKTAEYACKNVRFKKVTFLEALTDQAKRFRKIEDKVSRFATYCKATEKMRALDFLKYIDSFGYGKYMQENKMDRSKFELLLALADENPTVPDFLTRLDQLRSLTSDQRHESKEGIILTTAHSSKGLEYDTVYLMDIYDGQFPSISTSEHDGRKVNMDMAQEERRLFYVAMTRAKNSLNVITIDGKHSSFAKEIFHLPDQSWPEVHLSPIANAPSRYSISQYMQELEKRQAEQAEMQRKVQQERENARSAMERAAAEQYAKGFSEVKDRNFQTEEMIVDSFGTRWLWCERCESIKSKEDFSLIGRRYRPAIGICTECARKMT